MDHGPSVVHLALFVCRWVAQGAQSIQLCFNGVQDWELTSGGCDKDDAISETSDMQANQDSLGKLPTAQEVLAAIEAQSGSEQPSMIVPRGSGIAAADGDAAAAVEAPIAGAPASVTTSIINEFLESGGHRPEQAQQQQQQPAPEEIARAKWWDKQIAEGNLSMLPEITIMHVNIMAWGESGLGKTVRLV